MDINRSDLSQKFIDLFVGTLKFTEEEFELMLSHFRLELIPRNFFYLKAGNTSKQKAYINKGSTRTFTVDAKAREHILFFRLKIGGSPILKVTIHSSLPNNTSRQWRIASCSVSRNATLIN